MKEKITVLICDDDSLFHLAVKQALKSRYDCRSAYNGDEALAIIRNHSVQVVLLDIKMRTEDEGLQFIPRIREAEPDAAIVMSSALTDYRTVKEAMRLGASDYMAKDFDPDELDLVLERVLGRCRLLKQKAQQDYEVHTTHLRRHHLVGESAGIRNLRGIIEKLRRSQANVVITGETGTGKEIVARQLRTLLSDGSLAPFVAVDSSTIQSSTAESTLFGHEKGAFTGAERVQKGIFEEANGGIVYFDEIANMPLEIQSKLLRVLQEKEVTRMGSSKTIPLEFRVVCATNRDLRAMVDQGRFKDDLMQRLNVIPVNLPPLRERREDIPLLLDHFVDLYSQQRLVFGEDAIAVLKEYHWPGNVRELGNLVNFLVTMDEDAKVEVSDLPPHVRNSRPETIRAPTPSGNFYELVEDFEAQLLRAKYDEFGGNVSQMAMGLAMDRSHLHAKLKYYRIHATRPPSANPKAGR